MSFRIEGLAHRYGDREVLRDISLRAGQGALFGLLGPNGSGKSTLLRILATLEKGWTGRAQVAGHDVAADPGAVRRSSALVLQDGGLDARLTIRENLLFFGQLFGLSGAALDKAAERGLGEAGLSDRADTPVKQLSGGQKRRVEIARATLGSPKVLLLDEASTGLDVGARQTVWAQIRALQREGDVTVLFTTHLLDEAEQADHLALLDEGRVVAEGTPAELKQEVSGETVEVRSTNPARLNECLASEFGLRGREVGGALILTVPNGASLVSDLYRTYSSHIESTVIRKPGLEDAYLRHTGRRWMQGAE